MDHIEIVRRLTEIADVMKAKGYPEAFACIEYLGHVGGKWECYASTKPGRPGISYGSTRWFAEPEDAIAATLAEVSSDALYTWPRKWTHEETGRTIGIKPAQSEAA